MLQGRVSHHSPFTQFLPPFIAAISMFLVRICSPCPQVTEQVLQFPNKLHVQLTKFMVKSNFWGIYNKLNNDYQMQWLLLRMSLPIVLQRPSMQFSLPALQASLCSVQEQLL